MTRSSFLLNIILCCLGATLFVSCQDGLFFVEYKDVSAEQWENEDTFVYTLPVSADDKDVAVRLGIRTKSTIPSRKLTVRVEQCRDARCVRTQRVTIEMYTKEGYPQGHGFPHVDYTSTPFSLHLKKGVPYTLRVAHIMRQNPLEGIYQVGVMVEDVR